MSKKTTEPDEMRMPADRFDEIMRRALGVTLPPRSEQSDDAGQEGGEEQKQKRPKKA